MTIDIKLTSLQLRKIVIGLLVCNFLLLLGTVIINLTRFPVGHHVQLIRYQFDLGSENNAAVWYSSGLLFICALAALTCFAIDLRRFRHGTQQLLNYGWIVFMGCFAVLSFDELGSIHEHIGNSLGFSGAGDEMIGGNDSGWIMFYAVIALVGFFMLWFSVIRLRHAPGSLVLLIVGLLFYLSNPFQESFEINSMNTINDVSHWERPLYLLILEEGTEIYGSLCFLVSMLMYGMFASEKRYGRKNVLRLRWHVAKNNILRIAASVVTFILIGMLVIDALFGEVSADPQTGVPRNWLPSMMALLVAIYGFYKYAMRKVAQQLNYSHPDPAPKVEEGSTNQRTSYLLFSLYSLLISAYYACDRFDFMLWNHKATNNVVRMSMAVVTICAFVLVFLIIRNIFLRAPLIAGALLVLASIFTQPTYAPGIGVVAFIIVLGVLTANDLPRKKKLLA